MGKVIFWIVVVFVVLFALRLVNVQRQSAASATQPAPAKPREAGDTDGPLRRAAASSCRGPTRGPPRAAISAATAAASRAVDATPPGCDNRPPMQPAPAAPSFEPPAADRRRAIRRAASCGSSASIARSAARCCSASRCCSTCKALGIADAERVRHRRRPLFRVRPRSRSGGSSAIRCRCRCRR